MRTFLSDTPDPSPSAAAFTRSRAQPSHRSHPAGGTGGRRGNPKIGVRSGYP
ncbi:hypothetical protein ACFRI7_07005 [Streptomyces sp. NPDC056716]|uniref:hypothetical protein n=1 Tax=Streptomyces sp. NPDC056716 TaxID=3345922 RepID=UPI003691C89C